MNNITTKRTGRPKKIIDYKLVEKLASVLCTQEEIAKILDISVRTLQQNNEFLRIYKKSCDNGKMSLRRMQYNSAKKGNVTMQIWLGKQWLGQTDKTQNSVDISQPIKLIVDETDLEA